MRHRMESAFAWASAKVNIDTHWTFTPLLNIDDNVDDDDDDDDDGDDDDDDDI